MKVRLTITRTSCSVFLALCQKTELGMKVEGDGFERDRAGVAFGVVPGRGFQWFLKVAF